MPSPLIIRLHPVEPISVDEFSDYLNNLSIDAPDVSFADTDASDPPFGTANYIMPVLPPYNDASRTTSTRIITGTKKNV